MITPKELRHGFGVADVTVGIPLNVLQKWLGHAQLITIYANTVGAEKKDIARRMWGWATRCITDKVCRVLSS